VDFLHALEGVICILFMVLIGYYLSRIGWFNKENSKILPRLVNYIALPPYMLWNLTSSFDKEHLENMVYGLSVPLISMLINFIIAVGVAKLLKVNPKHRGTFCAAFFCSSTLFVGIPVNQALFGDISLPYVLLYFLINVLLFWTIGNYSISTDGKTASVKIISWGTLKSIFSPPLIGFLVAIAVVMSEIHLPIFIISTAKYLGNMTTPLSMIFIGTVMYSVNLRDIKLTKDVLAVVAGRFVISPLVVIIVVHFIPIPDLMKRVFVIQSALPVMTQAAIVSKIYEADSEYAAVLVTLTTALSLIAIPIYMAVL
jgi:malate permease and related proteins